MGAGVGLGSLRAQQRADVQAVVVCLGLTWVGLGLELIISVLGGFGILGQCPTTIG